MCFAAFFSIQQQEQVTSLQAATDGKANLIKPRISMDASHLLSTFEFHV